MEGLLIAALHVVSRGIPNTYVSKSYMFSVNVHNGLWLFATYMGKLAHRTASSELGNFGGLKSKESGV